MSKKEDIQAAEEALDREIKALAEASMHVCEIVTRVTSARNRIKKLRRG